MKIIDCHYHLRNYHFQKDLVTLKENMIEHNLDKVITLATYFSNKESGLFNYRLYHHIENMKGVYMFCSLDFEKYYYTHIAEVEELILKDKVRGIKIYSGYQDINYNSDRVKHIFKICPENKFLMFHTGFCEPSNNLNQKKQEPFNPLILEKLIKENPKTKVILAHLGNPYYKECAYLMNTYKNVFTDNSGLMDKMSDKERALEALNYILKSVNINKVLFGTDFPVQTYEFTEIILNSIKDEEVKNKILTNGKILFN